ncbi:MAG: DnaA family protein [Pseudohongiellaceae bacterium]|jgi:DnaA family protein
MLRQIPLPISLEGSAIFDNFFLTDDNRALLSTLKDFGTPKSKDNFIYLWGEAGSGVSYLLSAIQNNLSALTMQYLPLKDLSVYSPTRVLEDIDQLQLICIDDIEVIVGNRAWEEALFHLFNQLRDQDKHLVIASHKAPRELALNLKDLYSRLQWGTVMHIKPLDDGDKQAAIQVRATQLGLELPDDVANFLLKRVNRSSADLFAIVSMLDKASLINQRKLTIPFVKQALSL